MFHLIKMRIRNGKIWSFQLSKHFSFLVSVSMFRFLMSSLALHRNHIIGSLKLLYCIILSQVHLRRCRSVKSSISHLRCAFLPNIHKMRRTGENKLKNLTPNEKSFNKSQFSRFSCIPFQTEEKNEKIKLIVARRW